MASVWLMRAPWLWLWLAPWLVCSRGATIIVEHECGDLCPTTEFLHDGECDDGGPTSKYYECPRFSDATDCQTQCASHSALPPPPPSCELSQWATSAHASSSLYSVIFPHGFSAEQATGTLKLGLGLGLGLGLELGRRQLLVVG